jgi:hypothetical protein
MCQQRRQNEREPLMGRTPQETDSSAHWGHIAESMMNKGMFKGCRARAAAFDAAAFGHSGIDHLIAHHVNRSWSKPSKHQLGTGGNPAGRSSNGNGWWHYSWAV